ncbi:MULTISPECIES: LysR family transcriptional regulator [Variovorax]|uniref:DNA-binding transcriptional LysR family regulator n=1 Tax=Variovorax paradoxus TaxID=34073 RepID=A0AAE4BW78_VARPD|nr:MULTISPECIES: LysR family transcriptional regulator [Variovorax]MBD9667649.1 LysR family transcriptional regulator [Variovorax sp. VRV01]MDR6425388.1 DNA-binding transcriptional LysR family regulator [Variovorax paradoxus]MDR6453365.1 DNA-binding transcriptional LysR family regulator [Variovorax paradoxus]WPH14266.1 LysR family transcriptional regulator [Variovorax paradoxus]
MDVNFRTLDLNLLRVFDEVMAERNLTRAARNLSITQPAVSNALRRLREVLGDELVRRSGAGVEPTPRALALWPTVRDALRQLQHTLAPGEFDAATADTTFLLAMADATAAELIPGLVRIVEKEAPAISLRVLPLTTRDPRRMLEQEEVDMAIGYFPAVIASLAARGQSGVGVAFETQRLYLGQYVCVMRRGHPLANAPLTLDDYCAARHLLVSFSGRPYGFIDQTLGALGRERRIVVTVNQFFTAGRVVANSDLLTVLPRHFVTVTGIDEQLVLRDLPFDQPMVHVDAIWHRRAQHGHAHEWLRTALLRSAAAAFADSVLGQKVPG